MKTLKPFLLILFVLLILPISFGALSSSMSDAIPLNQSIDVDISANSSTSCTTNFYLNNGSKIYSSNNLAFTVPVNTFITKGIYKIKTNCSDMSVYTKLFFVTKTGELPASDGFSIFIWLLFALSFVGMLITFMYNLALFTEYEVSLQSLGMSWGAYLLFYIALFLSQTYMINTFIENWIIIFLVAGGLANFLMPLVGFVISALIQAIENKKKKRWGENER